MLCCTLVWLHHFQKQRQKQTTGHAFEREQGGAFSWGLLHTEGLCGPITAEMLTGVVWTQRCHIENILCLRSLFLDAALGCCCSVGGWGGEFTCKKSTHLVATAFLCVAEWNQVDAGGWWIQEALLWSCVSPSGAHPIFHLTGCSRAVTLLASPPLTEVRYMLHFSHPSGRLERSRWTRCEAVASVAALCSFHEAIRAGLWKTHQSGKLVWPSMIVQRSAFISRAPKDKGCAERMPK